ncbi:MAG: HEAT repeat domain-containing protein [Candidatus Wallbacteria bacterium]|nr:HEAT repeat domain-containing protein [Candidatus Wallbacteria bacterium]
MLEQIEFDLGSEVSEVRRSALRSLIQVKDVDNRDRVKLLKEVTINEQDPELRALARKYLDIFSAEMELTVMPPAEILKEELKEDDDILSTGTAQEKINFLKQVGAGSRRIQSWRLLKNLENEQDVYILATLISALGKVGEKKDAPSLIRFLKHTDSRVRANTVDSLTILQDEESYQHVVPLLSDPDARVKANAARLLTGTGLEKAIEIFRLMIQSGKVHEIESAIFSLRQINAPLAEELLQEAESQLLENMKSNDFFEFDFSELSGKTDKGEDFEPIIPLNEPPVCPKCGVKNLIDASFCYKCGTPIKT